MSIPQLRVIQHRTDSTRTPESGRLTKAMGFGDTATAFAVNFGDSPASPQGASIACVTTCP